MPFTLPSFLSFNTSDSFFLKELKNWDINRFDVWHKYTSVFDNPIENQLGCNSCGCSNCQGHR